MSRQTVPAQHGITTLYPRLAPLSRTAVRLHPRTASSDVPVSASKIGGSILWPLADPWPTCTDLEYTVQQVELAPDDPFYIMTAHQDPISYSKARPIRESGSVLRTAGIPAFSCPFSRFGAPTSPNSPSLKGPICFR